MNPMVISQEITALHTSLLLQTAGHEAIHRRSNPSTASLTLADGAMDTDLAVQPTVAVDSCRDGYPLVVTKLEAQKFTSFNR